ncbi:hypothetical protein HYS48_05375 [Candidatus Woesearchaeota archaeon]|nr:hypothetical protein [Candidatus Woesearchaeota archaeon]
MNAKADISAVLLFSIGLVLAAVVIFSTVGLFVKLLHFFTNKPDEGTYNSFALLEKEIKLLRDEEKQAMPYYLKPGLYLRAGISNCPGEKLCICEDIGCENIIKDGMKTFPGLTFSQVTIEGRKGRGVKNIAIGRVGNKILIAESTAP